MNRCDEFCRAAMQDTDTSEPAAPGENTRVAQLLASASLFAGLTPAEIAPFARGARETSVTKGDILFHRGDACTGFHLILSGQIKLAFISAEGNEKVVEILSRGQSFGEAVMFMDKPYVVMAQALTDCSLLHIAKQVVFDEMGRDPIFCRKIIAGLSRRLHQLMSDVESYSLRSGRDRIIGYLLREEGLGSDDDVLTTGPVSIRLPTSKGIIASRLNLTQEHFSRILHELIESGLIQVQGRNIHVPDLGRLRATLS
ncbi:Crp/Fnr family transcriptional regulator [Parazoarcus communis]|uniref:Crp/Fnr family transcriptional regulator n=1 Tax=Parazoarcus communis TaxID=41977 RepID=A0A2U8H666_9RHOO|nr:Crp/Fnr family transcriptional regulator [Parazoarcus communis]